MQYLNLLRCVPPSAEYSVFDPIFLCFVFRNAPGDGTPVLLQETWREYSPVASRTGRMERSEI
eukprot:3790068-Amphidinium_carterae.1